MAEVALLAVARMLSGVCIAGRTPGTGAWVRPVKAFGTILTGDVRYAGGEAMQPFDVVDVNLVRPRPDPPHVEDWTCDFVRPRPRRVRRLSTEEREALLESSAGEPAYADWLARRRSLCVVRAEAATAHFVLDGYSSHYEARLEWQGGPQAASGRGCPVTDLRWRALGRRLLPSGGGDLTLTTQELRARLGCKRFYLTLGLSRNFQGQFWPLVAGVHCLPDYDVEVDLANP